MRAAALGVRGVGWRFSRMDQRERTVYRGGRGHPQGFEVGVGVGSLAEQVLVLLAGLPLTLLSE